MPIGRGYQWLEMLFGFGFIGESSSTCFLSLAEIFSASFSMNFRSIKITSLRNYFRLKCLLFVISVVLLSETVLAKGKYPIPSICDHFWRVCMCRSCANRPRHRVDRDGFFKLSAP